MRRQMWDEANKAYDNVYEDKTLGVPYLLAGPYQKLLEEYKKQERWDQVYVIYEKLIELGPRWLTGGAEGAQRIYFKFAELCESKGECVKAKGLYKKILYFYPEDEELIKIIEKKLSK